MVLRTIGLALIALALCAIPARPTTLREALAASGVDAQELDPSRLERKITSYASLSDAEVFVIAYYRDDGSGRLGDTLSIDFFNRRRGAWLSREIQRGEPGEEGKAAFGGSVVGISRSKNYLYLNTHVSPSAAYTLVLTAGLDYFFTVYGWPLAVFPDGLLVFQNSEVHFAPTHYTEVSVFDPGTKRSWLIYPRKPYQQTRLAHIAKVRAAYEKRGEDWFREHNHHGDPELFDNFRRGEVAADPESRAVAFRIAFDNTDTWDYAEKLKFQRFGGLGRGLQDMAFTPLPVESACFVLGEWLARIRRQNLQDELLDLFKRDSATQEMLRKALELPEHSQQTWQQRLTALDPRWSKPEVWRRLREILTFPPGTTEVVCLLRNIDDEQRVECRELLASDYERRFDDLALEELLKPERIKEVFAQ